MQPACVVDGGCHEAPKSAQLQVMMSLSPLCCTMIMGQKQSDMQLLGQPSAWWSWYGLDHTQRRAFLQNTMNRHHIKLSVPCRSFKSRDTHTQHMHTHAHRCTHTPAHTHLHTSCTHLHTHMHTPAHAQTHAHTHTHMH